MLTGLLAGSTGCYYTHLADGQLRILLRRQPLEDARSDPERSPEERALLGLVLDARRFAHGLGLRVEDQYTSFVPWPGERIVTTVVRTPPGSLEPQPFWFPFVGRLPYKGYFDVHRAQAEAAALRDDDYDVCVTGVSAYSTLGWLDDPVTGPMLRLGPTSLAETVLHELVHATAFVRGETTFNEGVALFIGQEAAIRLFSQRPFTESGTDATPGWPEAERVREWVADRRAVARVLLAFRSRLVDLQDAGDRAARRALEEARTREALAALPLRALDPERVAREARLSDACLALRGTYARDLPRHARVLDALGGDLPRMIARLRRWDDEGRPVEAFFDVGDVDPIEDAGHGGGSGADAPGRSASTAAGQRPGPTAGWTKASRQGSSSSTTPSCTRPRKTWRQASVSTSASWAPSSARPV